MRLIGWTGELRVASIFAFDDFALVPTASGAGTIYPAGLAPGSFGTASVIGVPFTRSLLPLGLSGAFSSPTISNFDRAIDQAGNSIIGPSFGSLLISYNPRFVYPLFMFQTSFGEQTIAHRDMPQPLGFGGDAFGTPYVHDNHQGIDAQGFNTFRSDSQEVDYNPRVVAPRGFPSTNEFALPSGRWGIPTAYNKTQVVTQNYFINPDQDESFGSPIWMQIANRNRSLGPTGLQPGKVSHALTVENTGRALLVTGFDSIGWGADTFIAYRIRNVTPTDPIVGHFGTWDSVRKPPQLFAVGISPIGFGLAAWSNPPQSVRFVGHMFDESVGTAFVAPRVRSITLPLGPESRIGTPSAQLKKRYLVPNGLGAERYGNTTLEHHRNIFLPRAILPKAMGEPFVRNNTPQLYTFGKDQSEYGKPTVRYNPYPIYPAGFFSQTVERPVISHRERAVVTQSVGPYAVSTFAQVRNLAPEPPSNRTYALIGFDASSFGAPVVTRNELYPVGFDAVAFGGGTVTLIGAIVPGLNSQKFGNATVKGPQYIFPRSAQIPDQSLISTPRMSPFTIYCTADVPPGYTANGSWTRIDDDLDLSGGGGPNSNGERPFFGVPDVSNQFRVVLVAGGPEGDVFGLPGVDLRNRVIHPSGPKTQRMGTPIVGPFPQTIDLDIESLGIGQDDLFGAALLDLQNNQLFVNTWYSTAFGVTGIENFNRSVSATGWDSSAFTAPPGLPEPLASTRVHFPEPVIPVGLDATLWGGTMIDFRIRTLAESGWDSFTDDYLPGGFYDKMTVRHVPTNNRTLRPRGLNPIQFGDAALKRMAPC